MFCCWLIFICFKDNVARITTVGIDWPNGWCDSTNGHDGRKLPSDLSHPQDDPSLMNWLQDFLAHRICQIAALSSSGLIDGLIRRRYSIVLDPTDWTRIEFRLDPWPLPSCSNISISTARTRWPANYFHSAGACILWFPLENDTSVCLSGH